MLFPEPNPDASKGAWRGWAKRVRQTLPKGLEAQLIEGLEAWPPYRGAAHVLSYMAFGSELDLGGLDTSGKELYLTRTVGSKGGLSVHKRGDGLERHRLGFWQPQATSPEVRPDVIDLALVPGLVFDTAGNRLGYGLGYYDRLLPHLRPGIPVVGVTADALVVPSLPNEALDVPVTHLLTESGVRKANNSRQQL